MNKIIPQGIEMNVKITLVNDKKNFQLKLFKSAKAYDALKKLDIPPDTVIITRNKKPIPIDTPLEDDDKLDVLRVVSGG